MAELAGGRDKLRQQLLDAIDNKEYQWALQLSDQVLRLNPKDKKAMDARIEALTRLGEAQTNPNARHYYLMSARELRDDIRFTPIAAGSDAMLRALPMSVIMNALATNLHAEKVLDVERRVGITFTDTGEQWTIWLRRGVAEVVPRLMDDLEIHVRVDSLLWKKMLGKVVSPVVALAKMDFEKGGRIGMSRFLLLFKPEKAAPEPTPLADIGE